MNVLELFAGVGGFRVGLEKASPRFKTLWSNQFEPSRKSQDAFEVYNYHFPESENWNEDITTIPDERFSALKGKVNLIVGGFPCQDYSVARTKKDEQGIEGKKGVLFWEIIRATKLSNPKYLLLENVDRLLKAPSKQRGRDFAIMLRAFADLGYGSSGESLTLQTMVGVSEERGSFSLFIEKILTTSSNNKHWKISE